MRVTGRMIQDPVVSVTETEAGPVIRIDDNRNPEFWVLVEVPTVQVMLWAARINRRRHPALLETDPPPPPSRLPDES